ncbi:hypothetical protein [Ideonella sp.]|uniref:hypothetical protein n=1 Tax=Ideonella sp. TaxID=1929293 RepID=UPI002B494EEE|nr:hypothetical protein [Ideonella sp.]HJV69855.1 hypothetical protein [Ideonella sp.]
MALETIVLVLALAAAAATRPWRVLAGGAPPWPWLAWWAVLPLLWCADTLVHMPIAQPLSGACLLMLMAGWPLAMLALVPVALIAAGLGDLAPAEALHRMVWLGIVPATLALGLGAAIRRWLPHHLFVYILGRGFFASLLALAISGWLALAWHGSPAGTLVADLAVGRWLAAWGDAFLTGMMVAIFVALRPEWLATYSDRLYLPRD